ncbi:MAG: thiamine pyrophosphate-requiring protein [Deltaproteobacteria bacterium]|nr:thiamine pyrophosphate-requiring protein [Deltaproteobacteria bacterium]
MPTSSPRPRELVLFLHAVGGVPDQWAPQRAALAGRYATRAVDLSLPAEAVSMAAMARLVLAAMDEEGYARAHLVGLSMGGVVALETFAQAPERVRSLTLANTWAHMADGAGRVAWVTGELAARGLPGFSAWSVPGLFAPTTDPAVVQALIAGESAKDPEAYLRCWEVMFAVDYRPLLAKIDVPTLLIGGPLDPVTPTEPLLTTIAQAVPTARLVDLPGASHFSNLDQPEAFTRALIGHLRDARAPDDDRVSPDVQSEVTLPEGTCARRLLDLLQLRGVEALFTNSGTDFTPIIDALAHYAYDHDGALPLRVVPAPHENTAVAMAHGYALLTGRAQAVMAHVNVGTANMGLGLINARRARAPMLALAGRTPLYESGKDGVRSNFVQWGQESFDQAASFREFTKWDYELRSPHALDTVLDRALAITESEPRGPVYLTLPKEPLCEPVAAGVVPAEARQRPERARLPDAGALSAARAWIRGARRVLIVTADLGRHPGGPEALVAFARAAGAGVIEHGKRNFFNFPTEDIHHLGFDPMPEVGEADLILAVECPVPWIPAHAKLPRAPRVISIGVDPLFADLPLRGFPVDLALAGDPTQTLRALANGLALPQARLAAEGARLAETHARVFFGARRAAAADAALPTISKRFLSWCIGQVIDDHHVIFNEYPLDPVLVPRRTPASWFENSVASGLGWSMGAALGGAMAAPDRDILVTVGDGSYLFNTPLSAHAVAAQEGLGLVVIVFNDQAWSTIKRSTRGSHPQGWAARTGRFELCDFSHDLDIRLIAQACGAVGVRLERPEELPRALAEALSLGRGGRQVLLDVRCARDG